MAPFPGPVGRLWRRLASQQRRQRLAAGVLRGSLDVARRLDGEIADMHVVRAGEVFGVAALLDPCAPPGKAFLAAPGMALPLPPTLGDREAIGEHDSLSGLAWIDEAPFFRRSALPEGGRITFDPPPHARVEISVPDPDTLRRSPLWALPRGVDPAFALANTPLMWCGDGEPHDGHDHGFGVCPGTPLSSVDEQLDQTRAAIRRALDRPAVFAGGIDDPMPVGTIIRGSEARRLLPDGTVLRHMRQIAHGVDEPGIYRVIGRQLEAPGDRGVTGEGRYRIEAFHPGEPLECVAECVLDEDGCEGCTCHHGATPCPHCVRVGEVADHAG